MLAFAAVPAPGAQTTAADVLALLDGEGLLREVALVPGEDARSVTLDGFGAAGGAGPATLAGAWIVAAGTGFAGGMLLCDQRSRGGAAPAPGRVIADDVHIGGQASVQRGSLGTTRVGRGSKIGPHTNVAHNAQIGADVLIVGHVQIGGGARVGDGAVIGQGVVVKNGVSIGEGALIAMGSAIRYDVAPGDLWSGNPAKRVGGHHGARRARPSL